MAEPLEDSESELADESSTSSPKPKCSSSPSPGRENEDNQANLTIKLPEPKAVGKQVKEFRKDTKQQLLDIRGELDKTNTWFDGPRSILFKFLCFMIKEKSVSTGLGEFFFSFFFWNKIKISPMAMPREYQGAQRILKEKDLRFRTFYPAGLESVL